MPRVDDGAPILVELSRPLAEYSSVRMSWPWLLAVGCGRLGFTPLDDAPPSDTLDPDAPPARVCDASRPFATPVLVPGVNVAAAYDSTFAPTYDELTAFFYSSRGGNEEIYIATRLDRTSAWTVAPVPELANPASDAHPALSADQTILVFYSTRAPSGADGDLWLAHREAGGFVVDAPIADLSSTSVDYHAAFRPGSDELYFSSSRAGAFGVFRATHLGQGMFSSPSPVSELELPGANTSAARVSQDGLEIYFRSDRAGGQGGYDIWTVQRASTLDPFGTASVVPEVSSPTVDTPNWLSPDGCRLYLSSDRTGDGEILVASRTP